MGNKEKEQKKAPELFQSKGRPGLTLLFKCEVKGSQRNSIKFSNKNQNSFPGSTASFIAVLFGS